MVNGIVDVVDKVYDGHHPLFILSLWNTEEKHRTFGSPIAWSIHDFLYGMMRKRLYASCHCVSGYYAYRYNMKGSALAQQLRDMMNMLYDIQNEV